ncbi:septal ring lytic transglycosylase RlpA family protein [Algoriphagus sediminis]|uniref:Probable endolytic peptidoglycan transglycosylase RlpA n=1 Tax=Algoriphagus sediminis TaxID=3057113 RepID=A0ABT7YG04_9BACT|nr:septal ring lytic transglycosylase RlpA family protein [Algoriphagus sediminis]MDN3205461.1 septal ring lytic transglycosylase RlpA family protein [Algoriphagus sediminis]
MTKNDAGGLLNRKVVKVFLALAFTVVLTLSGKAQIVDTLTIQEGLASFYGKRFHGRMTASGEIFHMDSMTAAHKSLPFDSWVKVTRADTGQAVWVRINDRLPKTSRRIIDLSRSAAMELDMINEGLVKVSLEIVKYN